MAVTIAELVRRASDAHEALSRVAEPVDDEWQYVADLGTVWRGRLAAVAQARGKELATDEVAAAVDRVLEEAAAIGDPHRAIDWLSTLPQVVLLALGEAT